MCKYQFQIKKPQISLHPKSPPLMCRNKSIDCLVKCLIFLHWRLDNEIIVTLYFIAPEKLKVSDEFFQRTSIKNVGHCPTIKIHIYSISRPINFISSQLIAFSKVQLLFTLLLNSMHFYATKICDTQTKLKSQLITINHRPTTTTTTTTIATTACPSYRHIMSFITKLS